MFGPVELLEVSYGEPVADFVARYLSSREAVLIQSMCRYWTTVSGRFIDSDGNDLEPSGYITFRRIVHAATARSELVEYRAKFLDGSLRYPCQRYPARNNNAGRLRGATD